MLKRLIALSLTAILCACGAIGGGEPAPLAGVVTLRAPAAGAVIYSSALYVSGTVENVASKNLLLQLLDVNDQVIAQTTVENAAGEWSVEWVHGATPQPAILRVVPADDPEAGVLVSSKIILAALSERPDGVFITLSTPEDATELGGDAIFVTGTASGLATLPVTVTLTDSSQVIIAEQTVTLTGHYALDEIPWSAELNTEGKRGNAVLRVSLPDGIEQAITVILVDQAG